MSRTPMSILLGLLSVLFRAIPTLNLTIALLFVTRYPWKGYSFDSYSCFLMCWTLVILRRQQDCLGLLYLKLRSLGCFFLDLIRSILIAFLASTPWPTAMWHPKSHLLFPERSTRHRLEQTLRCMAYLNTCSLRFHKNHLLFKQLLQCLVYSGRIHLSDEMIVDFQMLQLYLNENSGNVTAQGMVQQVAARWSPGRMEEGKRHDVPPCSLPYQWRQLPAQHHCQTPVLHLPQRASCGMMPQIQAKTFTVITYNVQ